MAKRELHIAFDSLARSAKQQKVLTTYLQLSGVAESPELASLDVIQSGENEDCKIRTVTQEELMNECHCTAAVLRGVIGKGILQTYRKEVGAAEQQLWRGAT